MLHSRDSFLHHFSRLFRANFCTTDKVARFLRPFGRVFHRRGDLFQCSSSLLDGRCLLFRTLGQIVSCGPDLVRAGVDAARVLRHLVQSRLQLFRCPVEVAANTVKAGHERLSDPVSNVALSDLRKGSSKVVDGELHVGSFFRLLFLALYPVLL
ncbi:hypothetical protein D3C80_1219420 [compost metagenome]